MYSLKILRQAHERIVQRLLSQQPYTGRGIAGQSFWAGAQAEAWALPTSEIPGTQDEDANSMFVLGASSLGGEPLG